MQPIASGGSVLVKEEQGEGGVRPQAICLNCFPSLLPLLVGTAREFCAKYLQEYPERVVEEVLRGVEASGEASSRARGVRELVAAVFYCQHYRTVRLKIKDFAQINQLTLKLFNRKYMAYRKALASRARAQATQTLPQVKLEEEWCKWEYEAGKEEQEEVEEAARERLAGVEPVAVGGPKEAIELIFDGLFRSPEFQERRRELIAKMADRCREIPAEAYAQMAWTPSRSLRIFYAVYARLKQLGMSVGFTRYREAVEATAGLALKRAYMHAAERIVNKFVREGEGEAEGEQAQAEAPESGSE